MTPIEPQDFKFEQSKDSSNNNDNNKKRKEKIKISIGTQDFIAIGAVIVAIIFAIAMAFQKIPVNGYTCGVVGFTGIGGVIAKIIGARKKQK